MQPPDLSFRLSLHTALLRAANRVEYRESAVFKYYPSISKLKSPRKLALLKGKERWCVKELFEKFNDKSAGICIVGLGYVGLPDAVGFAEKGGSR